jgi:hypothetical protein
MGRAGALTASCARLRQQLHSTHARARYQHPTMFAAIGDTADGMLAAEVPSPGHGHIGDGCGDRRRIPCRSASR